MHPYLFLRRARPRLLLVLALVAVMVAASCDGTTTGTTTGTAPRRLGVFRGTSAPSAIAEYEAWLSRDVLNVNSYWSKLNWATMKTSARAQAANAESGGRTPVMAVPIIPDSGGSLSAGSSGSYDIHWRELAAILVSEGQGTAILRLGWEFNGGWYKWSAVNAPATFASYWRRIVTQMRSVAGAGGLRFDWNPGIGPRFVPLAAYPGDAYVNYIGFDVYDRTYNADMSNPVTRWNDFVNRPYGLAWHANFAASHGKRMSFPEWSLSKIHVSGNGDNPYFIEQMKNWINSHNVEYFSYFEQDSADGPHRLMLNHFPNAEIKFKAVF